MEDGRGERKGMVIGHSRKGAIDLLQKEAAVNGLFFNESLEKEKEREREREREAGKEPMEKWNFPAAKWNFERKREPSRRAPAVIRASVILR